MPDIRIHPAAELFPMMTAHEFAELVADIKAHGVKTPIVLRGDDRETAELIDGRNRLKALVQLGLDPYDHADLVASDDIPDPVQYVVSLNLHRRHLTESQRSMVATKIATLKQGERTNTAIAVSQAEAAAQMNVSVDSVQRARKVKDRAVPAITEAVERGEVSVSAAATVADMPAAEQQQLADAGPAAIKKAAAKKRKASAKKPAPAKPPKTTKGAGPLKELRELFEATDKPDTDAINTFAEWVMKQTDLGSVIHPGCSMWIEWSKE